MLQFAAHLCWDKRFFSTLDHPQIFDLMCAAKTLGVIRLFRYASKRVALMAKDKTPTELRLFSGIRTDEEDAEAARAARKEAEARAVAGEPGPSNWP
ncbi:unnamed protein product [Caenorhabditis sp. 36 PRJEB53466]|nr:unnamed protein product [Caenorhabditis sp. 36 PRJEB53466]